MSDRYGNFTGLRIVSSIWAAFWACCLSLPFDNIKTKYQKMVKLPDGTYPYKGFSDCFARSIKAEGLMGLYVGFPTYVIRISPHAIISLLLMDLF